MSSHPLKGVETVEVLKLFSKLSDTKGWANGRDVETLARSVSSAVYKNEGRMGKSKGSLYVNIWNLMGYLEAMLEERVGHVHHESNTYKEEVSKTQHSLWNL